MSTKAGSAKISGSRGTGPRTNGAEGTLYFDKTEKFCIGGTEGSLKDGKLVFSDKCSTGYKVKIV